MNLSYDDNHHCIVSDLSLLGCTVQDLADVGGGCPDIIVGYRGVNYFIEIKNPKVKGKLNKRQIRWHTDWRGQKAVCYTLEQCCEVIGIKLDG